MAVNAPSPRAQPEDEGAFTAISPTLQKRGAKNEE